MKNINSVSMKNINNFIIEKFKISKDNVRIDERESKASKGAAIEVDLDRKYVFMIYDPNSGVVSCFDCDSYNDLVSEWGYDEDEAKKIVKQKSGQSYIDASGAIYTKISDN